jgi:hypothetical protein
LLYKNPTPAISAALNAPLVDATSSIDERFFKSPIDKALGSGCGPPAGAELAVAVGAFAVALVGFFNVFFFVAICYFSPNCN